MKGWLILARKQQTGWQYATRKYEKFHLCISGLWQFRVGKGGLAIMVTVPQLEGPSSIPCDGKHLPRCAYITGQWIPSSSSVTHLWLTLCFKRTLLYHYSVYKKICDAKCALEVVLGTNVTISRFCYTCLIHLTNPNASKNNFWHSPREAAWLTAPILVLCVSTERNNTSDNNRTTAGFQLRKWVTPLIKT